jgi:hypothetical protein
MAGDAAVPHPNYENTMAIQIAADPSEVWPWLAQMGYRRGGLYSYDWLDRLFGYLDRPSATEVLPHLQNLRAGDIIPIRRGGGFPVQLVDPERALVLGGGDDEFEWIWEFGLYSDGAGRTRLVTRNRVRTPRTFRWWLTMLLLRPAAFIMTRRMLIGIRERAERLHLTGGARVAAG